MSLLSAYPRRSFLPIACLPNHHHQLLSFLLHLCRSIFPSCYASSSLTTIILCLNHQNGLFSTAMVLEVAADPQFDPNVILGLRGSTSVGPNGPPGAGGARGVTTWRRRTSPFFRQTSFKLLRFFVRRRSLTILPLSFALSEILFSIKKKTN